MRVTFPDWPTRFAQYVETCARKPFKYGVHDCFTFTNGAVRALRGSGFADDIIGDYAGDDGKLLSVSTLKRIGGFEDIPAFVDSRMDRISHELPCRGSLVAVPSRTITVYALGIAWGDGIVTVADYGTSWVDLAEAVAAWRVEYV